MEATIQEHVVRLRDSKLKADLASSGANTVSPSLQLLRQVAEALSLEVCWRARRPS